jgi:DNA repair protein RecO (recombination protein O)
LTAKLAVLGVFIMASRHRSIRTEGVILRRRDFGEKDRLLTIFTRKMGRVGVIAKGVRNPQSKKSGHVEMFMRSSLLIAKGRNLHILTQAEMIDAYGALRESLVGIGFGSYVVELLDAFTYEEGSNLPLYKLLLNTLERLNEGRSPDVVLRYYELHLLDHVGFRPQLFRCVECEKEIVEEDQFFSGVLGGVVCPDCSADLPASRHRPITSQTLKYARHFQRSPYPELKGLQIPERVKPELENVMGYYLTSMLESELRTPEVMGRIKKILQGDRGQE